MSIKGKSSNDSNTNNFDDYSTIIQLLKSNVLCKLASNKFITMKRIVGIFLVLIGVVIGLHFIIEPLFHIRTEAQPYSPIWFYLDFGMILAILLGLIFGYNRIKATCGTHEISRESVTANFQFYGFILIGILFFRNFFDLISDNFDEPDAVFSFSWVLIDTFLPILCVSLGLYLIKSTKG